MITKNAGEMIEDTFQSVQGLVSDSIIVDDESTDNTLLIAGKYKAKIFSYHGKNLGDQRKYGLKKVDTEWVLMLDSDEKLSSDLQQEINHTLNRSTPYDGYSIPYQNHFLGHPINYGGENYSMIRLFKKDKSQINSALVHEGVSIPSGKVRELSGKILHYSYNTLQQTYSKFFEYALREAEQKYEKKEKVTFAKLFLYAPHMFFARYIKDKGYKDTPVRILLDVGFAYMELITYWALLLKYIRQSI